MTTDSARAQLARLRQSGAADFDTVRLNFLDALVRRTETRSDKVRAILEKKLASALADYADRFERHAAVPATTPRPAPSPLAKLVSHIERHSPPTPELKAIRHFRNTWSKLSVDQQIAQAILQAPENPGPLNSHMLALHSLALMKDISPDYLNRFMSWIDALLCLDQTEKKPRPGSKKTPRTKATKR